MFKIILFCFMLTQTTLANTNLNIEFNGETINYDTGHYELIEEFSEKFECLKRNIIGDFIQGWYGEQRKDEASLVEVVLIPKKVHNVTWVATKKLGELNPHYAVAHACNRGLKDQEILTDEQEFTYTMTDSSTVSDSTDISIEGGGRVQTGVDIFVLKTEIEVSFKAGKSTGHSNSTTKETTKEIKIKLPSAKMNVPGQSMQKVVTKSFTSINMTLYLLAVEIDSDASYLQYRGIKFPFDHRIKKYPFDLLNSWILWHPNANWDIDLSNEISYEECPNKKNYYDVRLINLTNRNWGLKFGITNVPWEVKTSYLEKRVYIDEAEKIDEAVCFRGYRRKRFSTSRTH